MHIQPSENRSVALPRRWPLLVGGGLLMAGVALLGFQLSVREATAQDDKKSGEDIQDELRKALDSLKKGPDPIKEAKPPVDLNPIDQMRQADEALKKAQKDLEANPKSEEARKALEEATRSFQEAQKRVRPNFQGGPIAPINPEDLDKEIERFNKEIQQMMEDMQRQMQLMPLQPFPGNRFMNGGNRFGRPLGEFRLGVRLEKPTAILIEQLDLPADKGLVVAAVVPNSPADKAGIKPHDILMEIGGKAVPTDALELHRLMQGFKADQKVDVVLLRKGKTETLKEVPLPTGRVDFQPAPRILIPNFPIPNLPNGGRFPPEAFGGGRQLGMSITMNNGEFTIRCSEDTTKFTVIGVKDDGGPKVTSVEIDENGKVTKADSLDKLDARHRASVERMLRSIR